MKLYLSTVRDEEADALAVKSIVESGELEIHNLATIKRTRRGGGKHNDLRTKKMVNRDSYFILTASMKGRIKKILKAMF